MNEKTRGGEPFNIYQWDPSIAYDDPVVRDSCLQQFTPYLRHYASRFPVLPEDREDLIQEGRIALFRAMDRYRPARGPFFPFARLVVRRQMHRVASRTIKRLDEEELILPEDLLNVPGSARHDSPEARALSREYIREMQNALAAHLTRLELRVLDYFLDGYSYRDMARKLKREPKSIDNALRRVRDKIHTHIAA